MKNDWWLQVEQDLKEFQLDHFTLEQIEKMSKYLFKKFVKESCRKIAFQFLINEKDKLSKLDHVSYHQLEMQTYLKSKDMTIRQKKLLFRLKTKMVKVGHNYGKKILCPLCQLHNDDQQGLLECVLLKINCKELYNRTNENYEHIFSKNIKELKTISVLMQKILEVREELLQTE